MQSDGLVITKRFRGPASSGNGGYTAGMLADHLTRDAEPVKVVLRRPPPLGRRLEVRANPDAPDRVELLDGADLVATAERESQLGAALDPVPVEVARAAESSYKGLHDHPFPGCFVCGTGREPGDGLRLQPGPVGAGRTACTWVPDPSLADPQHDGLVAPQFVWAALDCPGGWTSDLDARPLVLGTMTAVCLVRPPIGATCVVVGQLLAEEGRKTTSATAVYDEAGDLLAQAEQVWIAVDPAAFGG